MRPASGLLLAGGRYELLECIAVGGMGEIWRAGDHGLDREVAIKVLREEFTGDQQFLQRLRIEARNSASLTHPNIAALYDYGEESGTGYLVMELVPGAPLSDLLETDGTIPLDRLLPILAQTARGLHAAHMAGVVHRDVKPSNILLAPGDRVKITDFGISLGAGQAPITATGMVMGTAQYLPPEQALGKPATPAGDIYALGIIAYESLVGRRPFTGSTQVDIALAHVRQPVPPMPAGLDTDIVELVMAMLDKNPANRPSSAKQLAHVLEAKSRSLLEAHATTQPFQQVPAPAGPLNMPPTPPPSSSRSASSTPPETSAPEPSSPPRRRRRSGRSGASSSAEEGRHGVGARQSRADSGTNRASSDLASEPVADEPASSSAEPVHEPAEDSAEQAQVRPQWLPGLHSARGEKAAAERRRDRRPDQRAPIEVDDDGIRLGRFTLRWGTIVIVVVIVVVLVVAGTVVAGTVLSQGVGNESTTNTVSMAQIASGHAGHAIIEWNIPHQAVSGMQTGHGIVRFG